MRFTILIIVVGVLVFHYLLVRNSENFIYLSDHVIYSEYWGGDSSEPSRPYVLWLELEFQKVCKLPIYRTGYPADWAFAKTIGLQSGVERVEVKFCPNMAGRCYLSDLNWMGSLREFGFDLDKSCNKKLVDTEWMR